MTMMRLASRTRVLLSKTSPVSSSNVPNAGASSAAPKAVSVDEIKTAVPATESNTETMMPWNGWLSRFVASKLGDGVVEKFHYYTSFRHDDRHGLEQAPRPSTKVPLTEDGSVTAMYRYPSPGSQEPVNLPTADEGTIHEDPYNVTYYPTDTRRHRLDPAFPNPDVEKIKVGMLPSDDPRVAEALEALEAGPGSSPGNKGVFATGKSDYDPSGLRAVMSTNHAAVEAEMGKHIPDHLPLPEWWDRQDEIIAWYEERDLPIPVGGYGMTHIPIHERVAKW